MQAVYLIFFLIICALFLFSPGGIPIFCWFILVCVTTLKIDRKLTIKLSKYNEHSYRRIPSMLWWIVFTIFAALNLFIDSSSFPILNQFIVIPCGGWLYLGIKSWLVGE